MEPSLSGFLVLNEGVLIIPVADLPEEFRTQMEYDAGDFAVSRLQSRSNSKIIDADAADLLVRFREQRTVVEAVILFAREKQLQPDQVLEGAYPFLRGMVAGGFLVQSHFGADQDESSATRQIAVGKTLMGALVLRTLQILEDTEVYLLSRLDTGLSVLKIERLSPYARSSGPVRARINHEAEFLTQLDGAIAPKLYGKGEHEGRSYLEMEFIWGVDVATAAAEWRERKGAAAQGKLLEMARAISHAYAALHDRGVHHGDVHPSNIVMGQDASVRLVDFGVARPKTIGGPLPMPPDRGGIPFFFEPEMAQASLAGVAAPASAAGEQHAVAALIFFLITGAHWQNFRLGREAMLQDIASLPPLSFSERGVTSWPQLEAVLQCALAKLPEHRFPSMSAFADALAGVSVPAVEVSPIASAGSLSQLLNRAVNNSTFDGPWNRAVLVPAPTTSINYGSAGVALGLLHVALGRNDGTLLALADTWSRRAMREMGPDEAFYNPEIEIMPEMVGKSSPYHSPSGVYAVATLVATAAADPLSQAAGLAGFLAAISQNVSGVDLTFGRSGLLLGSAILLDALPQNGFVDPKPLRSRGQELLVELWEVLGSKPEIKESGIEYLGIAHGWAGFLYATLTWCNVSKTAIPSGVERRLTELAALAIPSGRGLDWPWILGQRGEPAIMSGWCNGACGYVFLWTLAHRVLGDSRYRDLAQAAAWRSWEAPEQIVTLCCGLAGRSYALLNLHRHTNDAVWLDRAKDLALRAARGGNIPKEYPHSLYKGELGLAVLAADLERPNEARMPFFEPMGYRDM